VVPQASGNLAGSPVAGLTNLQNWIQYGIAIAGAVAPIDALPQAWTNGLVRTLSSAPDTTAPTISGVGTTNLTATSARINWTTNEAADTQVEYGLTASYGSATALNSVLLTGHAVNLSSLAANTTYHYRVKSRDVAGNLQVSGDFTFTTTAPLDTTPPTISGVGTSGLTLNGVTVTWTTNEASDTQIEYGLTTAYGSSTTLNTALLTSHSASLSGLLANTTYHYRVKSRDAAGNLATSGDYTFTTATAAPDTTAPTISGVGTSGLTHNGVTIYWTTNEAADTQIEYGLTTSYGTSTIVNTTLVTSHAIGLNGLLAGTTYHYRVKSRDAAGNLATSGDYTFTTAATPDTTAPTISSVATSGLTSSGVTVNWTTNEASNTQVEYGTTTGYGSSTPLNAALVTSHSAGLSGLAAGTTYHYRVKSRDASGNLRTSANFSFTTASAPDTIAPTISGVGANNISAIGATLVWSTNEASDTQVEYGLTTSYGFSTTLSSAKVTWHSVGLTALQLGTTYHYRVKSKDVAGNLRVSGDFTFTTASNLTQNIDDGWAGNARVGTWRRVTGKGFDNDIQLAAKGNGSTSSSWTFASLPNGSYRVWATWKISSINATKAPFTIYDGATARLTVRVNQRVTPTGLSADGALWKQLGTVTVASGRLVIKLTNAANGQVVADAFRIERVQTAPSVPQPEIGLSVGSAGLISGQGVTSFGPAAIGAPQTKVFTVTNQGTATLNLTAISASSLPSGFSIVQNLGSTSLGAGASTTFTLQLNANAAGTFGGWISLVNNDSDENPFSFQVSGAVTDPNAPYTQIIDDGSPGHSLAGSWTRNATKGYAGDIVTAPAGNGSSQSTWNFASVPNGVYQIWATWKISSVNATNAPFMLYDGTQLMGTVRKDQRQTPTIYDGTTFWESLGTITVTGGRLVVKLTNSANGQVVGDAIRIQRIVPSGAAPASTTPQPAAAPPVTSTGSALTSSLGSSDLAWSSYTPADYAPEAKTLDDVLELLNETRQAAGGQSASYQIAADALIREALSDLS
jgi:hypothetical protein